MGKKNKKSSTSGDDLAKTKKHKKSSTTEVETAHVSSLKNVGKSVLEPCSASKGNLKKQISEENDEDEKISQRNWQEIKEMWKAIKELKEAVKRQEEILQTIAEGKDDEGAADYCKCDEAMEAHDQSILVKGLDKDMGRRKDIKELLHTVFGPCGKIERIFVPIACQTAVPLGYAFITFEDRGGGNDKALKKNGEFLRGRQLEVKLAKDSDDDEFDCYSSVGCPRCHHRNLPLSGFGLLW